MIATQEIVVLSLPPCVRDLDPDEVDLRLAATARAHGRCEAALAFWFLEVERRSIFRGFGYRDTVHYASARHGIEYGPVYRVYRLLRAARACELSPALRAAFEHDEVALTKLDVLEPVLTGGDDDRHWVETLDSVSSWRGPRAGARSARPCSAISARSPTTAWSRSRCA